MVTYYNSAVMYRHQQAVAQNAQFHSGSPMHSWYASAGYHHQGAQMGAAAPTPSYCMQDEQQMWQHHAHPHSVFHQEFPEYVMHAGMPLQQHQQQQQALEQEAQLPSPPITVSGSDMSSPGAGNGNITPPQTQTRPAPVRSPYEWIKKTSYQTQPNPALETSPSLLLDYPTQDLQTGKTRTKDKYRVVYTDHQRIELEKEFTFNNPYITIRRKAELALNLGLSERQIKIWFQNRRAKQRKQAKKRNEEKCQLENTNQAVVNNPNNHYHPQMILNQHNQQMINAANQLIHSLSITSPSAPSPLRIKQDRDATTDLLA